MNPTRESLRRLALGGVFFGVGWAVVSLTLMVWVWPNVWYVYVACALWCLVCASKLYGIYRNARGRTG